ncbi:hypothetical protein OIU78_017711 [Salix suchowensis]|nr:hypothetical protein OIU78_017711 [Salix suchowensis]
MHKATNSTSRNGLFFFCFQGERIDKNPTERTTERNGGIYKEKGINIFYCFKKKRIGLIIMVQRI